MIIFDFYGPTRHIVCKNDNAHVFFLSPWDVVCKFFIFGLAPVYKHFIGDFDPHALLHL